MTPWTLIPNPHDRPEAWLVVLIASCVGAVIDGRSRRLPNALTLPLWAVGLGYSAWLGGVSGLGGALAASMVLALPYVLLFAFAGGGAGDAKMMGAVGAWLGLWHGAAALVGIAVMGGVAGVVVSVCRGESGRLARNLSMASTGLMAAACGHVRPGDLGVVMPESGQMRRMPYGVAILLGLLVVFGGGLRWHA